MAELSLLFVGAHPDDEGSLGGCLARYAAEGARVYVACATRGDGVDAQIKNGAATRANLGQVRSRELACACQKLGLSPPYFLGYQDGEVDKVPPEAAAWNVARLIREVRPAVVVTHGPEGGYGHPDHVAVSGFVTRAWAWAGDPGVEPELTAFAPAKLYYTALPRSFIEKIPGFRDRRADIRGEKLPFLGVADEKITARVDVRKWLRAKMEALACHRSQFEFEPETGQPKTFAAALPAGERLKFFGEERFVLARSTVQRNEAEDDLFAGLRA